MNHLHNKKPKQPLVSIIVPCYNHERYINQCIDSIYNQTYKNFELIVIDDGSKDNSPILLNILQQKYGFEFQIQENHGIAYTLNRGIREFCSGEYTTFCASDDYWLPDKIEKQVNFMERNTQYPMCYGKTHYVTECSKTIEEYDHLNEVLKGGNIFDDIFLFRFDLPVNYMFKTKIFSEVGGYDENLSAEDYFMNLTISCKYPIGYINEYLGFYRLSESNSKIARFDKISDSHLLAIEKFKTHPLYESARKVVYLRKFDLFAGSVTHKRMAVINLLKSFTFCYRKKFIFACIKLLFRWK